MIPSIGFYKTNKKNSFYNNFLMNVGTYLPPKRLPKFNESALFASKHEFASIKGLGRVAHFMKRKCCIFFLLIYWMKTFFFSLSGSKMSIWMKAFNIESHSGCENVECKKDKTKKSQKQMVTLAAVWKVPLFLCCCCFPSSVANVQWKPFDVFWQIRNVNIIQGWLFTL